MNTLLALPEDAQFVSTVQVEEGALAVRLIPESILEPTATAFVVRSQAPLNTTAAVAFLTKARDSEDYLYVYWRDDALTVEDEGGNELTIQAQSFSGGPVELTVEELKGALHLSQRLYEGAHAQSREIEARLQNIRQLLVEQARRVSIKAAGHEPDSAAGVLYAQQIQFLERLLHAAEA